MFKDNLFSLNHFIQSIRPTFVSLLNQLEFLWENARVRIFETVDKSLTLMRNSKGPRIGPCVTPQSSLALLE